jgi:4,5-dihydroxyphthalate decarboxylase
VVLRRDVYEARPWLARSLYKAFEEARQRAAERLAETAASRDMLPWLYAEAERTADLMGPSWWSYGLAGNEEGLATFLRYSRDQGLASRLFTPAELFAPQTLEGYVI